MGELRQVVAVEAGCGTAGFGLSWCGQVRHVVAVVAWQVVASSGRFWLGGLWQVLAVEARYGKFWRVEAGFGS